MPRQSLFSAFLLLSACGLSNAELDSPDDAATEDAQTLSLSCVLGSSCPAVMPVFAAVATKIGPSARTSNNKYWFPSAPAVLNVPRTALTKTLSGLGLERDDLAVWVSSSGDGKGELVIDEALLLEVRDSAGTVLQRLMIAGPAARLADKATVVPAGSSSYSDARHAYVSAPFDISPLLVKGRSLQLKLAVLKPRGADEQLGSSARRRSAREHAASCCAPNDRRPL